MTGVARPAVLGGTPLLASTAHRGWPLLGDEERAATARVLERGVLSGANAPEAVAFEREFATWVNAEHALLTHSGTSALHLALAASGVAAGDHVIVPAYSFVATPIAVLLCGAIPIFVDVDEETGLIDPALVASAITARTRAIMPVHIHGCSADLEALGALGLPIIEDAAQAHGATWNGRRVGALGRAGGFSLQSSKNLGVGEGGVFVTNDRSVAEAANRIRNFGQSTGLGGPFDPRRPLDGGAPVTSGGLGLMYRGNELTAALARTQLAKLDARTRDCRRHAEQLSRALAALPGVSPPCVPRGATSVHHKPRVRLDPEAAGLDVTPRQLRDAMTEALRAEGLDVVMWQGTSLPAHPLFQERTGYGDGFPWSSDLETDFAETYDPEHFPRTQRLLDGSVVLFSQACPLIAQDDDVVERYAEAFSRVWEHRHEIVARKR